VRSPAIGTTDSATAEALAINSGASSGFAIAWVSARTTASRATRQGRPVGRKHRPAGPEKWQLRQPADRTRSPQPVLPPRPPQPQKNCPRRATSLRDGPRSHSVPKEKGAPASSPASEPNSSAVPEKTLPLRRRPRQTYHLPRCVALLRKLVGGLLRQRPDSGPHRPVQGRTPTALHRQNCDRTESPPSNHQFPCPA